MDMTSHLVDITRWQGTVDIPALRDHGFNLVNVQATGRDGLVFPQAQSYVEQFRAAGFGVCIYHWLHAGATAAQQADLMWGIMQRVGTDLLGHQVDCEDNATEQIWREYVDRMQQRLQRPVVNYTGRWWWDRASRGWIGADLTPYLWAAPSAGYPGVYRGDTHPDWIVDYGGWTQLAVQQYAVDYIGPTKYSMSAVRDHTVWTSITGGPMVWFLNRALTTMRAEVNARWPSRDKTSDGTIGDAAHASRSSDHNPDPDGSVDAWDMDVQLNGINRPYVSDVEFVKRQFERHVASSYWIHNDRISRRVDGWQDRSYPEFLSSRGVDPSGRNTHTKHVHFNSREAYEDTTAPWGIKEEDVDLEDVVWTVPAGHPSGMPAGAQRSVRDILTGVDSRIGYFVNAYVPELTKDLDAILEAATNDSQTTVTMTAEERAALAADLANAVKDSVAKAVVDEEASRLAPKG